VDMRRGLELGVDADDAQRHAAGGQDEDMTDLPESRTAGDR
jgi:hypothetical protein